LEGWLDPAPQSVLDAFGPHAAATETLAWLLFGGAAAILALVALATALAVRGPAAIRNVLARDATVVGAGLVLPVVVLTALLVHGARTTAEMTHGTASLAVEVVGERWWWRVLYLDADGVPDFETANEIRLPRGQPVDLRLRSADVIHSLWVPALAGKMDLIPGRVNHLRVQADRTGTFRGQCAEYCGGAHALMALHVVAEEPEAFEAWRASQRRPAPEPASAEAARGRDAFLARGCPLCHSVRGTPARGRFGPDLTHVGSRTSLAAGILPNQVGTLAGWIASARHLKPETRMPSFGGMPGHELRALATYLEALR